MFEYEDKIENYYTAVVMCETAYRLARTRYRCNNNRRHYELDGGERKFVDEFKDCGFQNGIALEKLMYGLIMDQHLWDLVIEAVEPLSLKTSSGEMMLKDFLIKIRPNPEIGNH